MKKLLIVEDSREILVFLEVKITEWAYDVAMDFESAKKMLAENEYDLVLTDFHFPGGNGNDVAEIARKLGKPVWLHTANTYNDAINEYLYDGIYEKLDINLFLDLDEQK